MFRQARSSAAGAAVAVAIAAAVAAGCGGSRHSTSDGAASASAQRTPTRAGPFALLGASPAPAGWSRTSTAAGITLAYPPGWRAIHGDRGTLSAALRDAAGGYLGYLNVTPRQGTEREATWGSFRVQHNRGEGDRDVRLLALAQGVRFRSGQGACVKDSYTTKTGARYTELACLIGGAQPAVVLGAAPPSLWPAQAGAISQAISAAVL